MLSHNFGASAYGGGVEMILNCDLVVASDKAQFALPEVRRGVLAVQGGKAFNYSPTGYKLIMGCTQQYQDWRTLLGIR